MNYALASYNATALRSSYPGPARMTGGPNSDGWWLPQETSSGEGLPITRQPKPASIVDEFIDLLDVLPLPKKLGMTAYLSVRYYDGWHPSREEGADLIAVELGLLTFEECIQRKSRRRTAQNWPRTPSQTSPR
jgi:hypothetical protein